MNVIVDHNGQGNAYWFRILVPTAESRSLLPEETPLDRELQSTELARIMSSVYPEPLIYLGYVVTQPHAPRRLSLVSLSSWHELT